MLNQTWFWHFCQMHMTKMIIKYCFNAFLIDTSNLQAISIFFSLHEEPLVKPTLLLTAKSIHTKSQKSSAAIRLVIWSEIFSYQPQHSKALMGGLNSIDLLIRKQCSAGKPLVLPCLHTSRLDLYVKTQHTWVSVQSIDPNQASKIPTSQYD